MKATTHSEKLVSARLYGDTSQKKKIFMVIFDQLIHTSMLVIVLCTTNKA